VVADALKNLGCSWSSSDNSKAMEVKLVRLVVWRICCFSVSLGFLLLAQPAVEQATASEADVHYGLTYWLARKAGFSKQYAEKVAAGDYAADQGRYNPAPWVVALHIILDGDVGAAKAVRNTHFASFQDLPAPPSKRKVEPNSPAARKAAAASVKPSPEEPLDFSLDNLGFALHPLQDSWAHQGVPDIPFRPAYQVHPELSFGHPADRGGWLFHNADITCLDGHPKEVVAAAKATYEFLLEFLKTHPTARAVKPVDWAVLEPKVLEFARACTKEQKLRWFKSDENVPFADYGDQNFVQTISVPGIIPTIGEVLTPAPAPKEHRDSVWRNLRRAYVSPEQRDTIQRFFDNWLVKQDIPATLQFLDIQALTTEDLRASESAVSKVVTGESVALPREVEKNASVEEAVRTWAAKFLVLWLVEDHGLVNQMGHGLPDTKEYGGLPADTKKLSDSFRLVTYKSLDDAIYAPESLEGNALPYFLGETLSPEIPLGRATVVAFQFKRLPNDTLLLFFSQTPNGWKVSRMYWIVI
jgi:hypothetical protein